MMKSKILATKLYRPSTLPKRVQRPQLARRLSEGLEAGRKLTLVSAPAGFGKTTCIGEWLNGLDLPSAWLSLDASDDDPGRFFTYFVAALQTVDEALGRDIESVLGSGQLPPAEVISAALIDDILEYSGGRGGMEGRFLLVLDDFQVIQDRTILQVLEKLIANLPEQMHLVLITREDPLLPLARLRANNQMTEIRAVDLRFSSHEAERFLNELMDLSLAEEEISALEERMEGWIVGLQLAAIALKSSALQSRRAHELQLVPQDPARLIAALRGSHRHILSYLTEEVISRQPGEIQDFLLETSILDKLNGELCCAVTGRPDSGELLERLYDANLFLIPLDEVQQWYRYHHLFADLLRSQQGRLQKERTAELHRRASRWYAQADMPGEAIEHALAAKDYASAVELLESSAMRTLMQGYVKTVEGWMQAIPGELRSRNPRANLAFGWMHLLRGTYPQIPAYLEQVQAAIQWVEGGGPSTGGGPSVDGEKAGARDLDLLRAEWLALRSGLLNVQGKPDESIGLANQALELVSLEDNHVRSMIYVGLAGAYRQKGDYNRASEAYQRAIEHSLAAGNPVSEVLAVSNLSLMAIQHGQLRFAVEIASQGIARKERAGQVTPILAAAYGALGQVYYEWDQLDRAHSTLQRAIQLSTLGGHNAAAVFCRLLYARLVHVTGGLDAAAQLVQEAGYLLQHGAPPWVRPEVVSLQVRVALAQHNLVAAESALARVGVAIEENGLVTGPEPPEPVTHPIGLVYNAALRVLLYRARLRGAEEGLRQGIALADRLVSGALRGEYRIVALETLLVRAQMQLELGNQPACLEDVRKAVELSAAEGFLRTFVDEGEPVAGAVIALLEHSQPGDLSAALRNILAAFGLPGDAGAGQGERKEAVEVLTKPEALVEPLTERELEVLRWMAQGLKYEEIGEKMVISLNTVRFYVKEIYSKLNVNNRTRAVETARQLRLL